MDADGSSSGVDYYKPCKIKYDFLFHMQIVHSITTIYIT